MIQRFLKLLLWMASTAGAAGYVVIASRGLPGHGARDPVEAAVLECAFRVTHGDLGIRDSDLAVQAGLMPGLPFVTSGLVSSFGPGAWEPRLVTLLATILAAAIVAMIVHAETRSTTLGMAGAGLLLMGQMLAAGTPSSARPEALMLLLVLGGCLALRYWSGIAGAMLASSLMAAACFTHWAGLWFAFAALFHLGALDRGRCAAYAFGLTVLVGGGQVALTLHLGPWFNFQAWEAPLRAIRFEPVGLLALLGSQLLGSFGVLTLAIVLSFAMPVRPWRGVVGLWTWMGFAALGAGMAATQSATAGAGPLLFAVVVLAILGPISVQRVTHHLSAWPGSSRLGGQGVALTALALQFLTLAACLASSLRASGI